jgi:nitrile hydratase subunit beta
VNGVHDMGGAHGYGPVEPEPDEPVFHADWERRAFGLTIAMGATGEWNLDESRFAREDRPPADYLSRTYYEIWLGGLERLLAERGLVDPEEVDAGRPLREPRPVRRTLAGEDVPKMLGRGGPTRRDVERPARFAPGDRVRARNIHPRTHTRLPRYVRGHVGTVVLVHGAHIYPDAHARGDGEDPQWLYTVRFDGRELWGPDADPRSGVSVDAFEPYLEPAA